MLSYVSLLVTIKHHLEEGSIGITREGCEVGGDPERDPLGLRSKERAGPWPSSVGEHRTLKCRRAPAAITRKGYDALPARCVRMRFRFGPEHNNMFVIYSLGVTLGGIARR